VVQIIYLEQLCESDALSIDSLRKIFDLDIISTKDNFETLKGDDLEDSSFFHKACWNKNITMDIVKHILNYYPQACRHTTDEFCIIRSPVHRTSAYPLHFACLNSYCHSNVILKVLENNPDAIYHQCVIGGEIQTGDYDHSTVEGLPLHYYLSRETNVDLSLVKLLVEKDAEALYTADEESNFAPIHVLCCNPRVNDMLDVLKFLIDSDEESVQYDGGWGRVPFLMACTNKNVTSRLLDLILDYWPEAIHQQDVCGDKAMHLLSKNRKLDDDKSEQIFHYLLQKNYEAVRETNHDEYLPLHYAAGHKSPRFCKLLIDAYPESIKMEADECLPFYIACRFGQRVDTVRYLYELYPESLFIVNNDDNYLPFHAAARNRGTQTDEIIKYLLTLDPAGASRTADGRCYPLHVACRQYGVQLSTLKLLYNEYPEAVFEEDRNGNTPLEIARNKEMRVKSANLKEVVTYLTEQLEYIEEAKRTTSEAELPLHHVLEDGNASLGTIKYIVKEFPECIHTPNEEGAIPLLVACEHATTDIVKFLLDIGDDDRLEICAADGKYPLHYACIGCNHDVIKYLLEDGNVSSISERTITTNMLPFHLLCTTEEVKGSWEEFTESLWRVLTAYPDAILNA